MSKALNIEVDFECYCTKCNKRLEFKLDKKYAGNTLKIEPCQHCLDKLEEIVASKNYKQGFEDGKAEVD